MKYTIRPLSDRTAFTGRHELTPFRASWKDTLTLLEAELENLSAQNVVIEVDVVEGDLRIDGMLRANAKVESPGVRVAFDSAVGPLVYATDRYVRRWDGPSWQQNVRAIALGLQALRKVDRYGITKRGEQYAGFKALPSGRSVPPSHMTTDDAWRVLAEVLGALDGDHRRGDVRGQIRRARVITHPDRNGGQRDQWDRVEQAAAVLGVEL